MNKFNQQEKQIINDPSASYWLKVVLSSALDRDPLDALRDAEMLAQLLKARHKKYVNE